MIDNFLAGSLALFGDPFSILIFVFGVVGGMLFGAIPGVSMLTLAAILLPFTANFDPAQGVMLCRDLLHRYLWRCNYSDSVQYSRCS